MSEQIDVIYIVTKVQFFRAGFFIFLPQIKKKHGSPQRVHVSKDHLIYWFVDQVMFRVFNHFQYFLKEAWPKCQMSNNLPLCAPRSVLVSWTRWSKQPTYTWMQRRRLTRPSLSWKTSSPNRKNWLVNTATCTFGLNIHIHLVFYLHLGCYIFCHSPTYETGFRVSVHHILKY